MTNTLEDTRQWHPATAHAGLRGARAKALVMTRALDRDRLSIFGLLGVDVSELDATVSQRRHDLPLDVRLRLGAVGERRGPDVDRPCIGAEIEPGNRGFDPACYLHEQEAAQLTPPSGPAR